MVLPLTETQTSLRCAWLTSTSNTPRKAQLDRRCWIDGADWDGAMWAGKQGQWWVSGV